MLRFFQDKYSDQRSPIDMGLLENILRETLKITSTVDVDEVNLKKTVLMFLAGINYYFFLHPEQYVDFGKFVAYRGIDLKNLWVMEVKDGETAESIYNYMKQGGIDVEEVQKIVQDYTSDLLDYSTKRVEELTDELKGLEARVSQDESECNNKQKETKNGI